MRQRPLARFEHELVRYIGGHPGESSRQIHERFGIPSGYVRGTIVKSLDRLVRKGLVRREDVGGTFLYWSTISPEDLDRALVESFFRDRLQHNLQPVADYLVCAEEIPKAQLEILHEALGEALARA